MTFVKAPSERKSEHLIEYDKLFTAIAVFVVSGLSGIYASGGFFSCLGLSLVSWCTLNFVARLGKVIPVLDILLLLAGVQWIIAPMFAYFSSPVAERYLMSVPIWEYMAITVPAYFFLMLGCLWKYRPIVFLLKDTWNQDDLQKTGLHIFLIGLAGHAISAYLPAYLKYFGYLLSLCSICGALMFLYFGRRFSWLPLIIVEVYSLYASLTTGMFHSFILIQFWSITVIAMRYRLRRGSLICIILLALLAIVVLDNSKKAFRELLWTNSISKMEVVESFGNKYMESLKQIFFDSSWMDKTIAVRFNQGWIISNIYENIPDRQPYFYGEGIGGDLAAILLPRFLWENKKNGGGRELFLKTTGLELGEHTSINVSILGEGYAHWGRWGSCLYLFAIGVLLRGVIFLLTEWQRKNPLVFFMVPLVFFSAIKAETDTVMILNHIVKALFVSWLVLLVVTRRTFSQQLELDATATSADSKH